MTRCVNLPFKIRHLDILPIACFENSPLSQTGTHFLCRGVMEPLATEETPLMDSGTRPRIQSLGRSCLVEFTGDILFIFIGQSYLSSSAGCPAIAMKILRIHISIDQKIWIIVVFFIEIARTDQANCTVTDNSTDEVWRLPQIAPICWVLCCRSEDWELFRFSASDFGRRRCRSGARPWTHHLRPDRRHGTHQVMLTEMVHVYHISSNRSP